MSIEPPHAGTVGRAGDLIRALLPADVALGIEAAAVTLTRDREIKLRTDARAGVPP